MIPGRADPCGRPGGGCRGIDRTNGNGKAGEWGNGQPEGSRKGVPLRITPVFTMIPGRGGPLRSPRCVTDE